jgi:hypothetical protein
VDTGFAIRIRASYLIESIFLHEPDFAYRRMLQLVLAGIISRHTLPDLDMGQAAIKPSAHGDSDLRSRIAAFVASLRTRSGVSSRGLAA